MRRLVLGACVLIGLGLAPDVRAERVLRICETERELQPISSPKGDAPGQKLVRAAAQAMGDRVTFTPLPWRRCIADLRHGHYDGAIGVVPTETFLTTLKFPETGGVPDPRRSLGDLSFVVVRRIGAAPSWDGNRFTGLDLPVLYDAASQIVTQKLKRLGAPAEPVPLAESQMIDMLHRGRSDIAIGRRDMIEALLRAPETAGDVEMLPQPFVQAPAYLAFGSPFAESSPGYADRLWDEVGRLRATVP